MFNTDFARAAIAAFGALFFTVTTVGAAVGPARVVEITPLVYAAPAPQGQDAANA